MGISDSLSEIPQFKRAKVWCRTCGRQQRIDAVGATMGKGWPKCCGYTMTIDSPEEQRQLAARKGKKHSMEVKDENGQV